jgi:hypothetical protein
MANQTIAGLSTISSPSSAALAWVYDPNASPQDRSFSLANLRAYLQRKIVSTSGALGVIAPTVDTTYIFTAASTTTLPASPISGQQLTFKAKTTATSTISANSGQTIGTTTSTSFVLYAQEDYVTLEWDGTSIWYVVATNGPVQSSSQTGATYFGVQTTWTALGNGLTLGSVSPGIYDLEMDVNVNPGGYAAQGIAIGNGTTPVSNAAGTAINTGPVGIHVALKGYVLSASATIQGLYYAFSSPSGTAIYASPYYVGRITARRIG